MVPICEDCLADRAQGRPLNLKCGAGKDPARVTCRGAATMWAEARLQSLTALAFQGRLQAELDRASHPTRPVVRVLVEDALKLYTANADGKDKKKVVSNLRLLCKQWFGRTADAVYVDEFNEDGLHRWIRMTQTVGGKRKNRKERVSDEAWAKVRAMTQLPPINERTPATHNRTINTMIANLSQVFGENRRRYLREVQAHLPPLESLRWLTHHGIKLPLTDNRIEFTDDHLAAFQKHLPELRLENPAAWLMIQLSFLSGWRSGAEVKMIQRHWFVKYSDGTMCLERRHRPEEGYYLKTENQTISHVALPQEVAEYLESLPRSAPLFGHNPDATYRRCNDWLTEKGCIDPEWNDRLYALRKLNATSRARLQGNAAAAEALNHEPGSKVTSKSYVTPGIVRYEPLTMDMARAGQQAKDYVPWK
jgi:hypothetical protein